MVMCSDAGAGQHLRISVAVEGRGLPTNSGGTVKMFTIYVNLFGGENECHKE
jgi:hypothetical protein